MIIPRNGSLVDKLYFQAVFTEGRREAQKDTVIMQRYMNMSTRWWISGIEEQS